MHNWLVVGLSGVTNGGKSTLTRQLTEALKERLKVPLTLINQDDYFRAEDDPCHVASPGGLTHHNWDVITAIDMQQMRKDVTCLLHSGGGGGITAAAAVQQLHADDDDSEGSLSIPIGRKCVLLLDGFLLYDDAELTKLCDLRFFLTLGRAECARRRGLREYEPPDPPGYFEHCVWPMYERHHAKVLAVPGVTFLDGTKDNFQLVLDEIVARL